MIDLADPDTDVIKLYKEFKKDLGDQLFWEINIATWLGDGIYNPNYIENPGPFLKKASQLLLIWMRIGIVKIYKKEKRDAYDNNTYKFIA